MKEKIDKNVSRSENPESELPSSEAIDSKKKPANGGKSPHGFFRCFFSVLFSLILSILIVLDECLIFVRALNDNVILPSVWVIQSETITAFFDSWVSLLLCILLPLIPIMILLLINTHKIRKLFLAIGCCGIASAILNIIAVIFRTPAIELLPDDWQNTLVSATSAFKDFFVLCTIFLMVTGAAFISIYSCIMAIKGGKHEKAA